MMQRAERWLTYPPVTRLAWLVLLFALGPSIGTALVHGAVHITTMLWPVKHSWTVTSAVVEGRDVVLSGTMVKRWALCRYQPPPRARDKANLHYAVESSSITKLWTWPPSSEPYPFGPWRVIGGAGKVLEFYQEDDCLDVAVFTQLGTLDTRRIAP